MNGYNNTYQYNPNTHIIKEIWGIPAEWFAGIFLLGLFFLIFAIYSADWWKLQWYIYKLNRKRKKRLKSGRGVIKSFIIEVTGRDMSRSKFTRLTADVNAVMAGKLIKGVGAPGEALDANNIIGITDLPGAASHFFVVWYREV